jgi:hypothetical protein
MKLVATGVASLLLCAFSFDASAAQNCFKDRRIVQVNTGYVAAGQRGGPDGGDAVLLRLDDGRSFPLNVHSNLDWPRGQALHRVAMTALAGRYRVDGWDHYDGSTCDDIDELVIRN